MEFLEDRHHLFGFGGFGERREAAQVAEQHGDLASVAAQDVVAARQQDFRQLGRHEAPQRVEPLDFTHLLVDPFGEVQVPLAQFVGHPLLVEAGSEPGVQQHRIERFGEVVLGAEFDAGDDRVHLVDAGDDDEGDRLEPVVAGAMREQAVAVHLGHLDVGQDDVDFVGLQGGDRLETVAGLDHLVAERADRHRQHGPVQRIVVDDEHGGGHVGGHVGHPCVSSARRAPSKATAICCAS